MGLEIWDLYDRDRKLIGETHVRGIPLPEGCYHLVVHVWVQNDKGEVLLSKRHPDKHYGNLWEYLGGSVLTGETSLQGVIREAKEEIGLVLDQENGKLIRSEIKADFHQDIWLFQSNESIENLTFQPDEVIDAKWVNQDTFEKMMVNNELVPNLESFFTYQESGVK